MSGGLSAYKGRTVAKVFPGHNDGKPFKGVVREVDTRDKKTPFHIVYDDDDEEWVSLKELRKIMVEPVYATSNDTRTTSDSSKKRSKNKTEADDAPAAAQEDHPAKKMKDINSIMAADGAAGNPAAAAGFDAEKAKRDMKGRKDARSGMTQFTLSAAAAAAAVVDTDADHVDNNQHGNNDDNSGDDEDQDTTDEEESQSQDPAEEQSKQQAPAQAAAGSGGAAGQTIAGSSKAAGLPAPKGASKAVSAPTPQAPAAVLAHAVSPSPHLPDLLKSINQTAPVTAIQLAQDRNIARLPYKDAGATLLPHMSKAVIAGGKCYITLVSRKPSRASSTPGRVLTDSSEPDYRPEAEGLLTELDKLLTNSSSSKRMLLKVRVTLRDLQNGLPGFKAAWDAWVDDAALPVVTLYEGSSVFTNSKITLEATAMTL